MQVQPRTLTAVHVLLPWRKRRMGEELGWELGLQRGVVVEKLQAT